MIYLLRLERPRAWQIRPARMICLCGAGVAALAGELVEEVQEEFIGCGFGKCRFPIASRMPHGPASIWMAAELGLTSTSPTQHIIVEILHYQYWALVVVTDPITFGRGLRRSLLLREGKIAGASRHNSVRTSPPLGTQARGIMSHASFCGRVRSKSG
jgi:hypothetical protein